MRLNFELLEQKLGHESHQVNMPDSGRVFVVSGRLQETSNFNPLSQGSMTARGNHLRGDLSAGQDSLETVADFRARNFIEGTQNSSAFI